MRLILLLLLASCSSTPTDKPVSPEVERCENLKEIIHHGVEDFHNLHKYEMYRFAEELQEDLIEDIKEYDEKCVHLTGDLK